VELVGVGKGEPSSEERAPPTSSTPGALARPLEFRLKVAPKTATSDARAHKWRNSRRVREETADYEHDYEHDHEKNGRSLYPEWALRFFKLKLAPFDTQYLIRTGRDDKTNESIIEYCVPLTSFNILLVTMFASYQGKTGGCCLLIMIMMQTG
jgi:hypothetical protein